MKYLTSNEIRLIWLEFFRKKGHEILPSASLIPQNDKSILWVVAGVAPLKKYFDGSQIPLNKKMANVQKCIRTNDIENVGLTARHHTFFEMLGFFSIGDYFKKEAIEYAYELMFSQVYFGFDLSKIYITYYPSDVDCLNTWLKLGIKKERLLPKESNYWEIGEGPSGPNCEIFFDRGEEYSTINIESGIINDIENDRYIELINIVFSQYNAKVGVKRCEYKLLPNKNIDTGAGLERFACILQNVPTNFDTDLFLPIVHGIAKILNVSYENQKNIKIIADHIRTITMAINDGAVFANEGRGYILRRLLRRALKCAYEMGTKEPFLSHIVEIVINQMNIFYDFASVDIIKNLVYKEEVRFLATIDAGYKMLNEFKKQNTLAIDAKTVFKLYETYGFPIELTKEFASENNIQIDEEGFFKLFKEHQDKSRDISDNYGNMGSQNQEYLDFKNESNFTYDSLTTNSKVIKVFSSGVVLDITPFYATSGGQVCDIGTINNYNVVNVIKLPHKQHLHVISHHLNEGDDVVCNVDEKTRFETTKNHSATHLLHFALKHILGQHVTQQGSFVNHEVLRFDFNHYKLITENDILQIEKTVNDYIKQKLPAETRIMDLNEAKLLNIPMMFNEKYEDRVRVVSFGFIKELCGGTHVQNTKDIQNFRIISISSIGSGIYRVTANTLNNQQFKIIDYLPFDFNELHQTLINNNPLNFPTDLPNVINTYQDVINFKNYYIYIKNKIRETNIHLQNMKENSISDFSGYQSLGLAKIDLTVVYNVDKSIHKKLLDFIFDYYKQEQLTLIIINHDKIFYLVKSKISNAHVIVGKINEIFKGTGGGKDSFAMGGAIRYSNDLNNKIEEIKEFIKCI